MDRGDRRVVLDFVGLSAREQQVYRLLVELDTAGPADVAQRLAVPDAEAADVLHALRDKGLAAAVASRPGGRFRPLPPDVPLGASLLRQQEALEAARMAVTQLTEEYRAGARRYDVDHLVEIVKGTDTLRNRLRHMQESAREEILWFCRANPLAMAGSDNTEEFAALGRGVRYRAVYERALLEEPGALRDVEKGVRAGEQARVLPTLPVRLAIADRSTAICPLVPDRRSGEPTAAVVGRGQLLDALVALFESHWLMATPLRLAAGPEATSRPDEEEQVLLSLLVAGTPDKSIASHLGVSRRTVQRRVADLMALAGVDTRPGLAFQAARRGWI